MIKQKRCQNCTHFDSSQELCRKNPPVYIEYVQGGMFPTVAKNDWCGAYERNYSKWGD